MRRMLIASLTGHARRLIAGMIAIVLSVMFLAIVLIVMDSAKAGVTRAVAEQYAATDLVLTGVSDPKAVDAVAEVEGVQASARLATGFADITLPDDRTVPQPLEAVPTAEELRWQQVTDGALPDEDGQAAISVAFAEEFDLEVGDKLTVTYASNDLEVEVVGTVDSGSLTGGAGVLLTEGTFAEHDLGFTDEILIKGSPDKQAVLDAVGGGTVGTGDTEDGPGPSSSSDGGDTTLVTQQDKVDQALAVFTSGVNVLGGLLLGFVAIAMFVAILVVANTFTIVLAQRSRELALFRCVGASQSQIFRVVIVEALLVGLVGSIIGLLAGLGLAQTGISVLQNYVDNIPVTSVALTPLTALVSIGLGTVVTMFAAIRPASRATGVSPLAALQPEGAIGVQTKKGTVRIVFGAILLAIGGVLLALSATWDDPALGVALGVGGGVLSFVGVLWFGPVLVPAMVRLLGLIPRSIGVPGKVSVDNAVRNPRRTATTASALLIGVTLISLLTIGAATAQRTSEEAMAEQFPVDLTVQHPDTGTYSLTLDEEGNPPETKGLPESVVDAVSSISGIERTAVGRGVTASVVTEEHAAAGSAYSGLVVVTADVDELGAVMRDPEPFEALEPGTLLMSSEAAGFQQLSDGDQVVVTSAEGETSLSVRVAAADAEVPPAMVVPQDLEALTSEPALTGLWARAADDADPGKVNEGLQQISQIAPDAQVDGSLMMRGILQQVIDTLLLTTVVLLAMAVLIAFVGVWNTLSLSVLERVRENALLRALGLTRGQLRSSLAVEAALIAGAAVLIGLVLGMIYGYVGVSSILGAIPNVEQIPLVVPWGRVGLVVLVALAAGVLASVLPARGAARTPPAGNL